MDLIDRIKAFLSIAQATGKPKSKFRFGFSKGIFNRKRNLEENPLLAFTVKHPFKPIAKLKFNHTPDGHMYKDLIKKIRLSKLKPKQLRIAMYKLNSAGIDLGY